MDENKVKTAIRRITKDPAMKEQYKAAPSMPARRLRELSFYYMWYDGIRAPMLTDQELNECYAEMIRIQQKMGLIDWSYIYKCTVNTGYKEICRIHVEILQGQPVPENDWKHMVDNLPDFDPFKEVCRKKLEEMQSQE